MISIASINLCLGCMEEKDASPYCPRCGSKEGAAPKSLLHLFPGTVLQGKYLIGRVLGQGGFGITYLAWDKTLNIKLAIKEYLPQQMATRVTGSGTVIVHNDSHLEHFNYGLSKFIEEARILARFNEHPNIVSVRDYFEANGTAYIVMNYVQGVSLQDYLNMKGRKVSVDQALNIFMPVLDALNELHFAKYIHRDISPDNLLISTNGQVVIVDFGSARQAIGGKGNTMSVIMKAGYSPEEQYRSHGEQGPWTDIYAAAASFYRAITGQLPPESLDRLSEDTIIAPSRMGVIINTKQELALLKALAVRARDRFSNVTEFRKALDESIRLEGGDPPVKPYNQVRFVTKARSPGSKSSPMLGVTNKTISAGDLHSLVIVNGFIYSFGCGKRGQLGHGKKSICRRPRRINGISTARSVSAGSLYSLIITQDNQALSCGYGDCGRLGAGDNNNQRTPVKIEEQIPIVDIAAGWRHSLMLTNNRQVLSFGWGISGQLGLGSLIDYYYPQIIPGISSVKAISAGNLHSLILLDNGHVYSFGSGEYGQLGHGDNKNVYSPKKIEVLSNVVAISAGDDHSLVLLSNGNVYSFGRGEHGRLGVNDRENHYIPIKVRGISGVRAISAGGLHSIALTENGDVYSFGYGGYGQLGCGEIMNSLYPIKIDNLTNIIEISAGYLHSLVKSATGVVYSFGCGSDGRLGHGDEKNQLEPKLITDR